jgi:signal transduction histidine kinase/ligand-binding sensor domain-containing protein/ActR/RegA family two-component response regulator
MPDLVRGAIRVGVLVCLLGIYCEPGSAQHYLFRQFGQSDGLKNSSIRCMVQSRKGFLWLGTESGLYRFDGQNFARFTTAQGLPSNAIEALSESKDGTLWVGTAAGLITLRNGIWQQIRQDPPIVVHPQSIAQNDNGAIYIAAIEGLLQATWEGDSWRMEAVPSAPRSLTRSVLVDGSEIWFTGLTSLWRLGEHQLKNYSVAEGLSNDEEWAGIARDRNGNLFVRSRNSLRVLRRGKEKFELVTGLPTANWSDQLALDPAGGLVVPTDEGLRRGDGSLFAGPKNGLPDDPICCTITDREGQPWIGTATQGVYLWAGARSWEGYSEQDGLLSHIVNAIHRDASGALWVGTRSSLHQMKGSKLELVSKAPWVKKIRSVRSTPDGTLWIATLDDGLVAYDQRTGKFRVMDVAQGFSAQRIVGLDVIGKQLWAYTRQGVLIADFPRPWGNAPVSNWHFRRWTALEEFAPETREKSVYRVAVDSSGRLWVGTLVGLFVQENGRWQRFGWKDRLLEDAVAFLTIDIQGRIWLGYSSDLGVSRLTYEGGQLQIEHFTQKNYLTSNVVNFLEADSRGWVWLGTDSGVDVWRPSGWRHYDTEDGLIGSDTCFGAFLADRDGTVWIGTNRGLAHFDPSKSRLPTGIPAVALTDLEVNGRTIEPKQLGTPLPARATVKLRFSVLSFRERQHARFRYRLLGLDSEWIDDANGDAVFPNLGYGNYRFEVKAYHPLRGWMTEPAIVTFKIAPMWWQTPWAIGLGLLVIACILVVCWQWRIRALVAQKNALEEKVNLRTAQIRAEKLKAEQQKKRIEELFADSQRAAKLKDEFLANVSHELRTPLHGLLCTTELVLKTKLSPEQQEYLEIADQSAKSLLRLLNDVLDFSKIEAGKMTLRYSTFSLAECIERATEATAVVARNKGLDFRVLLADDLSDQVVGDPDRLRQVLGNFVDNAAKFTDRGQIQVLVFRDAAPAARDRIHFSIRDTGEGIPREKWKAIFEPFRQADGSATRRFGGTGLGLSIASRLIDQMHGSLTLDSEVGKGSTFSFVVPLPEPGPQTEKHLERKPSEEIESKPLQVLLVGDSSNHFKLTRQRLERLESTVTSVSAAREALDLIRREQFDLVITDVQMTHMDGIQLTKEIRLYETSDGRRTPVIVLTGNATNTEQEMVLKAGADAYVRRPLSSDDVIRVLETKASKQESQAPSV